MRSLKTLLYTLKSALLSPGDLTSRTIIGGMWTGVANISNQLLQIAKLVVLARLLSPADFGLFGIALLTLTAFQRFSRLGIDTALVQRPEEDVDAYLDTVFTLQILRGILIAGIAFAAAPLIATFFAEPRATLVVRVIVLSSLVKALYNPGTVYFQKDLEFHKHFLVSFSLAITSTTVAIAYALVSPTVWALVFGAIAGNIAQLLTTYAIHDYRPRPGFDRDRAAVLVNYGKWIFGSSVVTFIYSEGDDIFVGRVLGAGSLGLYQVAYQIANAPATKIAHTVSRVAMPAYSKVQQDTTALREGFHRVLGLSSLVTIPVGVGIVVVTPVFVPTFLGAGWDEIILPMQVLATFGVLRSLRTCASPLFQAVGRPDYSAKIHAIRVGVMLITIVPLTQSFGLAGTALSVLLTSVVGIPIATVLVTNIIDDEVRSLVATVGFPAVGSLLMGGCALAVRRVVSDIAGGLITFTVTVLTGVVVYAVCLLVAERLFGIGLGEFLTQFTRSVSKG